MTAPGNRPDAALPRASALDGDPARRLVVVFELRMLGDAVLSLPFVRTALSAGDVRVVCTPAAAPVFSPLLPPDRIAAWSPPWLDPRRPARASGSAWASSRDLASRVRALRPQAAVCSWADSRVHWLMACCGAPVRIGFPMARTNQLAAQRPWRRRQRLLGRLMAAAGRLALGRPLLTHPLWRERPHQHHIDDWRQVAACLGLPLDTSSPWIPPAGGPAGCGVAEPAGIQAGVARQGGPPVWLVHAGARQPARRWPLSRFEAVLSGVLAEAGVPVLIARAPGEEAPRAMGPKQRVVDTPSLESLRALTAGADCVLCNDSFPGHLAAALGKRVIAIFGPGAADWFAPYGSQDLVAESWVCPDRPCLDRCTQPSFICLEGVSVEQVAARVRTLMAGCEAGRSREVKPAERGGGRTAA